MQVAIIPGRYDSDTARVIVPSSSAAAAPYDLWARNAGTAARPDWIVGGCGCVDAQRHGNCKHERAAEDAIAYALMSSRGALRVPTAARVTLTPTRRGA